MYLINNSGIMVHYTGDEKSLKETLLTTGDINKLIKMKEFSLKLYDGKENFAVFNNETTNFKVYNPQGSLVYQEYLSYPFKVGKVYRFKYAAGSHPSENRLVKVDSADNNHVRGKDLVQNEWRTYLVNKISNVEEVTL